MTENKSVLVPSDICRVCMHSQELQSIFKIESNLHYAQKIMFCCSVQISPGDNLPSYICNPCINNLNVAYDFRKQCETSETTLKSQFSFSKDDLVKEECFDDTVKEEDMMLKHEVKDEALDFDNDCILNDEDGSEDEKLIEVFQKSLKKKKKLLSLEAPRKKKKVKKKVKKKNGINEIDADKNIFNNKEAYAEDILNNGDISLETEPIMKLKKKNTKIRSTSFECSYCKKIFNSNSQLEIHIRYHTGERPFACTECDKTFFIKADLNRHRSSMHENQRRWGCEVCGKSFNLKSGLNMHMRTHTGEKPFQCIECGARFTQSGTLREHQRTHTGEQPFTCPTCPRTFASQSALARHKRFHTGERRGQCNVCGKKFFSPSYLKHHMKTHTGERPFACQLCGKAFSMPCILATHMRTHTPSSRSICPQCGQPCTNIVAHMRKHTGERPYACPHCDKKFKQCGGLKYHLTIHTNERNHQCQSCDKKFKSKQSLKEHESLHTGERPFKCEICQVSFRVLSYKQRHNRIYHSGSETNSASTSKRAKPSKRPSSQNLHHSPPPPNRNVINMTPSNGNISINPNSATDEKIEKIFKDNHQRIKAKVDSVNEDDRTTTDVLMTLIIKNEKSAVRNSVV